ncbi:hypothetical protein BN2475_160024 [Paraburkholderia ribeironis]|uniref:Uncharacterized protein n=1 Tax=Paraburkholderia ribeironis TaxID=1247936 RepID=A0A1N7RU82_9BURK|nr:hypothetical protein BN2475_160024 [Paraburkholderia ribeironis]
MLFRSVRPPVIAAFSVFKFHRLYSAHNLRADNTFRMRYSSELTALKDGHVQATGRRVS